MNEKLIAAQRECYAAKMYEAASTISAAADKLHEQDLRIADLVQHLNAEQAKVARLMAENERRYMDCRNELCLKCGRYKTAHEGSCDGCRWKKGE